MLMPYALSSTRKSTGKFFLFGETDRFKKISLPSRGVADGGYNEIFFAIELNAPGDAAGGEQLRTGRRRHTPDVQVRVAVMRRHLAPAASGISLGEIFETKLPRGHAAPEHQSAVAIIRNDVIARFHLERRPPPAPRDPFRKRENVPCPAESDSARANPHGDSPASWSTAAAYLLC